MYFPNMQGYTLEDSKSIHDTTNALKGKFSIVSLVSEQWAERQAKSYTDPGQNPALAAEIERLKDKGLQKVFINVQEDRLKALIVRLSLNYWRKNTPKEDWHRTFLVRRGITDYTRRDINMPNKKIGHVYLVDGNCKIRWAGCGDATDMERESLVYCVRRLVEPPAKVALEKGRTAANAETASGKSPRRALQKASVKVPVKAPATASGKSPIKVAQVRS